MNMRRMLAAGALWAVAGAAVSFAGAPPAKVDRAAEEAALKALDKAWAEAANRKDLDATVAFMADDGETLAPNEPVARTKEAIRASWNGLMQLPPGSPGRPSAPRWPRAASWATPAAPTA